MYSASSSAAPPPRPPKPRTLNPAYSDNSASEDMNFKAFTGGGGGGNSDSSNSFAAARALFEAAKKPENRAMATAAAKNPVVRNAAISAAKNPQARGMMMNAASSYGSAQPASVPAHAPPPPLAPRPIPKDYGSSQPSYSIQPPQQPKKVASQYPNIMAELEALNLGKPPPPLATTASLPPNPYLVSHAAASSYSHPPPAAPAATTRSDWTKFTDAPARPPPPKSNPVSPMSISPTSEPYGLVKYPYNGSHFDELSCAAGDHVILKKEMDDQWIYGMNQKSGKFGIFPLAFLDIKIPLVPTTSRATGGASSHGVHMATALYDYTSNEPGDLSFYANAQIRVLERVSEEWLEGECDGRRGMFPSNFVNCPSLSSVPMKPVMPSLPKETVTASYDYNSGVPDDLVFFQGDVIEVVARLPDGEWIRGSLRGNEGLVPLTYVSQGGGMGGMGSPSTGGYSSASGSQNQSKFPAGTPVQQSAVAIADHHTADADMLYFSNGDRIIITEIVNESWAKGKLADFKTLPAGYFPRNYVQ